MFKFYVRVHMYIAGEFIYPNMQELHFYELRETIQGSTKLLVGSLNLYN